ncbi:hypothetical protein FGB62_15g011 [Gracilaria domingensis]|nr:hypothetical protein FGB62_15g011 [Gracilaria domingensis]
MSPRSFHFGSSSGSEKHVCSQRSLRVEGCVPVRIKDLRCTSSPTSRKQATVDIAIMTLAICVLFLALYAATLSTLAQTVTLGRKQYVTYEWCEVTAARHCEFAYEGLYGTFDHVPWGVGNYSLRGASNGVFTPRIVQKEASYYDSAVGYVKSDDSLRDVYACEPEYFNNGAYYETRCRYLNVPGTLYDVERISGVRGSGVSRVHGAALRRYIPNGACVMMYLTEYEIVDTSVSPPRVRETVRMSARQARIENKCVQFYTQY